MKTIQRIFKNPKLVFIDYFGHIGRHFIYIRSGPGTEYPTLGRFTGQGVFTIVEEARGQGASLWGLLKAYRGARNGWISLDYTTKI